LMLLLLMLLPLLLLLLLSYCVTPPELSGCKIERVIEVAHRRYS